MIESGLLRTSIYLEKVKINWLREIFFIDFVLRTNPWTYKTKTVNGKKTIGSFYEKELLLNKL